MEIAEFTGAIFGYCASIYMFFRTNKENIMKNILNNCQKAEILFLFLLLLSLIFYFFFKIKKKTKEKKKQKP